jgi:hypothetical protein
MNLIDLNTALLWLRLSDGVTVLGTRASHSEGKVRTSDGGTWYRATIDSESGHVYCSELDGGITVLEFCNVFPPSSNNPCWKKVIENE